MSNEASERQAKDSTTEDASNERTSSTLTSEEIQNYRDLLDAIRTDDLDGVRTACDRYPDVVKITESNGRQPLHVAAIVGNRAIVEELIERGAYLVAEVNAEGDESKPSRFVTPIDLAASSGHPVVVTILETAIDQKISQDANLRYNVLMIAAERGDVERVQSIVKLDPEIVKRQDGESWTPLLLAIENNQLDVVVYLLNHGADMYQCVQDGDLFLSAFDLAADLMNSQIPTFLRKMKKSLEETEQEGKLNRYESLLDAIRAGDLDGVRLIIKRDPNVVSFVESDGQQALHVAAAFGHLAIVEELVAKGADVLAEVGTIRKYEDGLNKLPVEIAAEHGHAEVVDLLNTTIEGLIANDPDFRFRALTLAAERGALAEVERIVALDPSLVKRQDGQGWTPLLIAVSNSHKDVVCHLLSEGADIYHWVRDDPKFFTAFDLAMDSYDLGISQILRSVRARLEGEEENEEG